MGDAAGSSSYARDSLASAVGRTAQWALDSDPAPISQEIAAISPTFALTMFGTNDVGIFSLVDYADHLLNLIDAILAQGVLPVLSTIPPRDDSEMINIEVPPLNAVVRAVAQARLIPLIDLNLALLPLENNGLGSDGIHPSAYRNNAGLRACSFGSEGLKHGYNQRNMLSLDALHRIKTSLLDGKMEFIEEDVEVLSGQGTAEAPYVIPSLPFSDLRDTSQVGQTRIDTYPGCSATQNESGPEVYYRLELAEKTKLRAMVFDRNEVDVDVHLLSEDLSGESCIQRAHHWVEGEFERGVYHFSLDTFVNDSAVALGGEYLFVVVRMP